ncbi:hypothetical protein AU186_05925 [Mycobacterium sp. GA-1999]|nr:hypothetical protein AU187_06145 [Mycobacterium sp. IS-1556]KUH86724.1 hypothetical protein AU185_19210 [Mycobacterium sp. GA-0227b]KUH92003.1 hypothetical protein AU186_05925 [Mycobacterium sp. GA-1999]
MMGRIKPALLMASLVVVTGISAPTADARPTCQNTQFQSVCQTNGSVSIKTRPGTVAPPANQPQLPFGMGSGFPGRRRG